MAAEYLFAVQDADGREVVAWRSEVAKVSEVTATTDGDTVSILRGKDVVASGPSSHIPGDLRLLRWPADDKLSTPVEHGVERLA